MPGLEQERVESLPRPIISDELKQNLIQSDFLGFLGLGLTFFGFRFFFFFFNF